MDQFWRDDKTWWTQVARFLEDYKCQTKGEKNWKASNLRRSLRKCYYQASLPGIKTPMSENV